MLTNQRGYILTECLVGVILLTTIGISLVQNLPKLLTLEQQLYVEQKKKYLSVKLYELKDQTLFYDTNFEFPLTFDQPVSYEVVVKDHQLCAIYKRGDGYVQTLCL